MEKRKRKPTLNQMRLAKIVAEKIMKGEKISMRKILKETNLYGKSISDRPSKVTDSMGYKESLNFYLPDEVLDRVHSQLLIAKRPDHMMLPGGDGELTDEEIEAYISECGCTLRRISHGEKVTYVYFYAPDNLSRIKALDMAFKRKGRYAPIQFRNMDPIDEMSDDELNEELNRLENQRKKLYAGEKSKVSTEKQKAEAQVSQVKKKRQRVESTISEVQQDADAEEVGAN